MMYTEYTLMGLITLVQYEYRILTRLAVKERILYFYEHHEQYATPNHNDEVADCCARFVELRNFEIAHAQFANSRR